VDIGQDVSPFDRAAREYRAAGWWPMPVRGKRGLIDDTTGYAGTVTDEKIAGWLDPDPLVRFQHKRRGHHDGITVRHWDTIAIDVDQEYGRKRDGTAKRGADALAEFAHGRGLPPLPPTWSSTARGDDSPSRQYFYRVPERAPRWNTKPCQDVELCTFHHRHSVVWPSAHEDTGEIYRWYGPGTPGVPPTWGAVGDRVPPVDELAELPIEWYDVLTRDALDRDPGATVAGLAELLDSFNDGPPGPATAEEIAHWSTAHVGHDEMLRQGMHALVLGRQGFPGARELWDVIHGRYAEYVREARPEEAERQLHGADGVVATAVRAAQQQRTGKTVLKTLTADEWVTYLAQHPTTGENDAQADAQGPNGAQADAQGEDGAGALAWTPVDLGPYLTGTVKRAEPTVGAAREDGLRFLYPGKEHACIGEMECGKSWFALANAAAELLAGKRVEYVHFEEDDPTDTVGRLLALGVPPAVIRERFRFWSPLHPISAQVIAAIAVEPPSLVVLDGKNEAMTLHGQDIMKPDGAAQYRARLVRPFTAMGAAVLSLDHVVKDKDQNGRGNSIGSVHKDNGLSGSLILLENNEPFGHDRRGASHVFVTKDRPGALRKQGQPTKTPRKFYMGTLVVDDTNLSLTLRITTPKEDEESPAQVEFDAAADARQQRADEEKVLAALLRLEKAGERCTQNRVYLAAKPIRKSDAVDALLRLIEAGRIASSQEGQATVYYSLGPAEPSE
jgi:hypothetical protein